MKMHPTNTLRLEEARKKKARLYMREHGPRYEAAARARDPEGYARRRREAVTRHRERALSECNAEYLERRREIGRQSYARNKDAILARKGAGTAQRERDNEGAKKRRYRLPELFMFRAVQRRAREKGLDFTISLEDISIPQRCPLLDIPLIRSSKTSPNSPSLDRKDSSLGYVPGNVWVISQRANTAKGNLTPDELLLLVTRLFYFLVS